MTITWRLMGFTKVPTENQIMGWYEEEKSKYPPAHGARWAIIGMAEKALFDLMEMENSNGN